MPQEYLVIIPLDTQRDLGSVLGSGDAAAIQRPGGLLRSIATGQRRSFLSVNGRLSKVGPHPSGPLMPSFSLTKLLKVPMSRLISFVSNYQKICWHAHLHSHLPSLNSILENDNLDLTKVSTSNKKSVNYFKVYVHFPFLPEMEIV